MKHITIILIVFLFLARCQKEEFATTQTDSNGVLISLPYQWKKSLHNNGITSNSTFRKAIYYNDNIAIPTTNGTNNRLMTLINPNNGDAIWSWDDRYQPETEDIRIAYTYQNNNLLTYQKSDRSYCINLDTGTTQWKFRREKPYDVRINSFNNSYITYGSIINQDGNREQIAFQGNIQTGELSEFLRANYSGNYVSLVGVGGIIYITQVPNQVTKLLVTYSEPLPGWEVNSFFGMYDISTNSWGWDRKLLSSPTVNTSVFTPPQIYTNKIIANVGKKLVCHNLNTGNQLWIKPFPQDFLFSGFIIKEDKIIATNEDGFTYALNPIDGTILWKTKTSGTSGRMSYLNGIVYFVGGASGKLHALDINTGAHVWKIDASRLGEQDNNNFKTNAVYVFPATNENPAKVIALSHLYAYSFEAYQ